ncbi:flippase-like domain-containing protein, partial [bacterium]|nr:flippase-like domain-containing protein [bacterium]
MKIRNKTLKFLVFLFVTALIFFVLFRRIDFKEVLIVLSQTDVKLFFLALGISAFACLVAGVEKYKWVLRFFGLSVSSREVRIFKLGSFPLKELMPFKSGEFIRAVFLKRRFDMPYYKGLSAVFTNYFLRIFILGFLFLVSWFYCRGFTRGLVLSLFSLLIFLIFAGKIFKTGIFSVKRHVGG